MRRWLLACVAGVVFGCDSGSSSDEPVTDAGGMDAAGGAGGQGGAGGAGGQGGVGGVGGQGGAPGACEAFVCENGGTCVAEAAGPRCDCAAGFEGDRCETPAMCTPGVDLAYEVGPCPRTWPATTTRRPTASPARAGRRSAVATPSASARRMARPGGCGTPAAAGRWAAARPRGRDHVGGLRAHLRRAVRERAGRPAVSGHPGDGPAAGRRRQRHRRPGRARTARLPPSCRPGVFVVAEGGALGRELSGYYAESYACTQG
ncbi:MAG: calcium-binding EGF-like domain-containing protein [bacterium]